MTTAGGAGRAAAALPLLPTRELVVFPKMVAPLFVGREKSIPAIETAFSEQTPLILSSQREAAVEDPAPTTSCPSARAPACCSCSSCRTAASRRSSRARSACASSASTPPSRTSSWSTRRWRRRTRARRAAAAWRAAWPPSSSRYVQLQPAARRRGAVRGAADRRPRRARRHRRRAPADRAAEKQALLEIVCTQERLLALLESLAEENAVLGIEQEIGCKVQQRIEGAQRQLLLHEKLRVIRDEIEEGGETADEDIAEYARRAGRGRPLAGGAQARRARATQAPAGAAHEPRGRGDPRPARHDPRPALGQAGARRRGRGRGGPASGAHALRPQGRQGPHPRVPGRLPMRGRRGRAAGGAAAARPPTSRPRSSAWPARPAPARAAWPRASPTRSAGPSRASPSAACATRPRSAGIAARTSGRCPGASSRASPRPASTTR